MSFGLALAGGGTRGAAHVGMLLALEEAGFMPSSIAGSSAGSIVAGLLVSGKSPADLKQIVLELQKEGACLMDVNYCEFLKGIPRAILKKEFRLSGLIKGDRLENYLWKLTEGKRMEDADRKIVIPTVDICSGKTIVYTNSLEGVHPVPMTEWKTEAVLSDVMRASSSVPGVFSPKWLDGTCCVDGGITNILPVDLLIASGEKNVLAVDISERYAMPEKINALEMISHSFQIMSSCLKEFTSEGERLLLRPNLPSKAGLLTFEYMAECMEAGYQYTKDRMEIIKSKLK